MMKMKKALPVLLLSALALVFGACTPEPGNGGGNPPATAPTAVIIANGVKGDVTGTKSFQVQFDASESTDPAGGALTYRWDFGSQVLAGQDAATQKSPSVSYGNTGAHIVTLTVTNAAGETSTATITVRVLEVAQPA